MSTKRTKRILTYCQAISEAHTQTMARDKNCFVIGLGVSDYKGIFGTTLEVSRRYGSKRVIETPASENALSGIVIGASLMGKRPVIIHARNDFMFLTLDQIINGASKWKYMYNGKSCVPVVIRSIIGKGWGQGPTHSQSLQSVFAHFPGIYVVMPASAYDAKGFIVSALRQDVPVIILEHRSLYDSIGVVPQEPYEVKFAEAKVLKKGSDITLVALSLMVQEGLKAHLALKKMGISLEVIDARCLKPLDERTILRSVRKTGRVICADTSFSSCSFSSDVGALVAEKAFGCLRAPFLKICAPECPSPVSLRLEQAYYRNYKDIFLECCRIMKRKPDYELIKDPIIDNFKGPY